jgi:predicted acyltransferase (DUF342 family)
MSIADFAAYTACCLLAAGAQLAFALREWRLLARREPMFVDPLYVRVERYFGLAFRRKLAEWLALPSRRVAPGVRVIDRPREEIWVHEALVLPAGARFDGVIAAETLDTGAECLLLREVHTRRDCRIGAANVLQALAADGDARIGRGTHIIRWIDVTGELVLEPDCRVSGRATSAIRLIVHAGAAVKSAHAPLIVAVGDSADEGASPAANPAETGRMALGADPAPWTAAGATRRRRRLAADCVAYDGDLTLPAVTITTSLVVRGNLLLGSDSVLHGDVKASGSIDIGARSRCHGSLVAGGDVRMGADVTFHGVIFAEGSIVLGRRVSGSKAVPGVAVYGARSVVLLSGATIRGKVSAGDYVTVALS